MQCLRQPERTSDALELELQDELPMWVLETEPGSWKLNLSPGRSLEHAKHEPSLQPLVRELIRAAGGTLKPHSVPIEQQDRKELQGSVTGSLQVTVFMSSIVSPANL